VKQRMCFYLSVMLLLASMLSFRWPVDEGRITSTFGESRGDHFHDGVDIVCKDDKVYPVAKGKLLYYWDKTIFPLENEPGGGNFRVLQHGEKIRSIYMHLEGAVPPQSVYEDKDVVGIVGNSGHSFSKHLHLSILNLDRQSVNPLAILPATVDTMAPKIEDMYLKIDDRYMKIRNGSDIRLTRHYPLLVRISDSITGRENLGVNKLRAVFNEKTVCDVEFNAIDFTSSGLSVKKKHFDELFDDEGYYKIDNITYRDGLNTLKIITSDFAGNTTEKEFTCSVTLDMQ